MNEKKKSIKGFTLVELMVVIAIIGIMAGIAIPSFIGWLPDYRLKNAVRALVGDLQQTRWQAIKNNANWAIVFDTINNKYLICSDSGPDGSWSATGDNTVFKTVAFINSKAGVKFGHGAATSPMGTTMPGDNVSYNFNVVSFSPQGTCLAGYVYMDNGNNDLAYAVGTQVAGAVLCRRWNGSVWN